MEEGSEGRIHQWRLPSIANWLISRATVLSRTTTAVRSCVPRRSRQVDEAGEMHTFAGHWREFGVDIVERRASPAPPPNNAGFRARSA
jgi:hypothetical protein